MNIFTIEFFITMFLFMYMITCPLVGVLAMEAETGKNSFSRGEFFKRACKNWFLLPIWDFMIIMKYNKSLETDIVLKARKYGVHCHAKRNLLYDGESYYVHLKEASDIVDEFIHLIPVEDRADIKAGIWVHDVIEDTGETFNNVKEATNETVAEYSYALTNEKGRNRKARANAKYYQGIRDYKHSEFLKKADRIANFRRSIKKNSRMKEGYKNEMPDFLKELNNPAYQEMTDCLIKLANSVK